MTSWETRFCRTVYNQNLFDVNLPSIRLSYTVSPPSHSCASQLPPANSTNKSTQLVVYIGTFTCFTTYLRSKKDHCEVSCHRRDRELVDSQRRTPTSHPRARPSQPSLNSVGFYSECPHQHHAPCLRLGLPRHRGVYARSLQHEAAGGNPFVASAAWPKNAPCARLPTATTFGQGAETTMRVIPRGAWISRLAHDQTHHIYALPGRP
jgi:hypothetical protein